MLVTPLLPFAAAFAPAEPKLDSMLAAVERQIPLKGGRVEDFSPPGWTIQSQEHGDLNHDGSADAALVLVRTPNEGGTPGTTELDTDCWTAPAIVVVLLRGRDGFRKAAVNRHLFPTDCELSTPYAEIRNGVLKVNHNWRDGWAVDLTYRFRFASDGALRLIGFDFEHYSRSDITAGAKTSINYSTGVLIESAKKGSAAYKELGRSRLKVTPIPFEDARLIATEDGAAFRPF